MNRTQNISFLKEYESLEVAILDLNVINRSKLKKLSTKSGRSKTVSKDETFYLNLNVLNANKVNPQFNGFCRPKVLLETKEFIFLHKPQKVHSLSLTYNEQDNLLSYLREQNKLSSTLNGWSDYGLINRLDFLTSGIVVFVKSKELKEAILNDREKFIHEKKYLAVIEGKCDQKFSVKRKLRPSGGSRAKIIVDERGEISQIDCKLLDYHRDKDLSLIEVKLYEGRRHQIRVLLQSNKTPIFGDPLYGRESKAKRMYLHHSCLKIQTLEKTFEIKDKNIDLFKKLFNLLS